MFLKILFVLQISYIQVYTDVYIEYEVGANDRHIIVTWCSDLLAIPDFTLAIPDLPGGWTPRHSTVVHYATYFYVVKCHFLFLDYYSPLVAFKRHTL